MNCRTRAISSLLLVALSPSLAWAEYPDLSEPKAAAYSLALALQNGDVAAARKVAVGEGELSRFLEVAERVMQAGQTFEASMAERYGPEMSLRSSASVDVQVNRRSLVYWVAAGEATITGNTAELPLPVGDAGDGTAAIRLRKVEGDWRVTDVPLLQELMPLLEAMTRAITGATEEVEAGRHVKAYDAVAALHRRMDKETAAVLQDRARDTAPPADIALPENLLEQLEEALEEEPEED